MCSQICASDNDVVDLLSKLKTLACPHCKQFGTLIKHGFLYGYDSEHQLDKTVRAARVFCSNRHQASGCGRTFSVWAAHRIKRLFLSAQSLWKFLTEATTAGNKLAAFRSVQSGLSDSAAYSIWSRFCKAQVSIRTALSTLCQPPPSPPDNASSQSGLHDAMRSDTCSVVQGTLSHLAHAFQGHTLSPIAAFALTLQRFIL